MNRRRSLCGALGALVLGVLLLGGSLGLAVGVVVGVLVYRLLRGVEPVAVRREREAAATALPFALDLLAGVLRAGLPVAGAVQVVAAALGGALGARLIRVVAGLHSSAPPAQAWSPVADLPGGPRLVTVVVRASDSGAALAGAFSRLADDLRGSAASAAQARAHRAGVLLVLPLGLCFLPAFVVVGVVPVIVAVLGGVLR